MGIPTPHTLLSMPSVELLLTAESRLSTMLENCETASVKTVSCCRGEGERWGWG